MSTSRDFLRRTCIAGPVEQPKKTCQSLFSRGLQQLGLCTCAHITSSSGVIPVVSGSSISCSGLLLPRSRIIDSWAMGRSKKTCEKDSAKRLKKGEPRTSGKEVKKEKSKPDVREKVKKERKASSSQEASEQGSVSSASGAEEDPGQQEQEKQQLESVALAFGLILAWYMSLKVML